MSAAEIVLLEAKVAAARHGTDESVLHLALMIAALVGMQPPVWLREAVAINLRGDALPEPVLRGVQAFINELRPTAAKAGRLLLGEEIE